MINFFFIKILIIWYNLHSRSKEMSINIALIVVSVIYSVFLNIIFYIKKTVSNTETRLFSWLVSTNLVGLIVELICFYTIEHPKYHMIGYFSNRLLLVYYLNFIFLMTLYVFSISYSGTKEDTQEYKLKYKKNRLYAIVIYVLIPCIDSCHFLMDFHNH